MSKINDGIMSSRYGVAWEFIKNWRRKNKSRRLKLPWHSVYRSIVNRLRGYTKRDRSVYGGVKNMISPAQLKNLFYEQKAYMLNEPSVDRIDQSGNYTPENVRWIELCENRRMKLMCHPSREVKYLPIKDIVFKSLRETGWNKRLIIAFVNRLAKDIKNEF